MNNGLSLRHSVHWNLTPIQRLSANYRTALVRQSEQKQAFAPRKFVALRY
jgi:hypothetical protein